MSDRERKDLASLPLAEFLRACGEWMQANYPGWKYGAITGSVGDGVPMVVLPITSSATSRPALSPSSRR
jgi:hypothetical protein